MSSQAWFWGMSSPAVLSFVTVPLESLSVPLPSGSVNHPMAFLLQKKQGMMQAQACERETDTRVRKRQRKNENTLTVEH